MTGMEEKTKKEGPQRGGVKLESRRRNSLVEEFKWNDEKKLEGRTGCDKRGFKDGERVRRREGFWRGETCHF